MPVVKNYFNAEYFPHEPWPANSLENLESCPVCENSRSDRLYEGLTDRVFQCAPGKWTLSRCRNCGVAYINPRPTPDSISKAYHKYFTHETSRDIFTPDISLLGIIKAAIKNDYLKFRFGVTLSPRLPFGMLVVYIMPYLWLKINQSVRHLGPSSNKQKLMDIGCGNGAFIKFASSLGWEAQGMDPDPDAVAAAHKAELTVIQGGFPHTGMPKDHFDVVTLNQVIEHVHDPIVALREVHRILKPEGKIWIATPNLDGTGNRLYKRHWRGLEPPRHLVIFNESSLKLACERAGFINPELRRPPPTAAWYFMTSLRIMQNQDPTQLEKNTLPMRMRWYARWVDLKAILAPGQGEELVIIATKP